MAASLERPAPDVEMLRALLGDTDIYLLDQMMKGRIGATDRILDAGCGGGRNVEPLLRCQCDVWAVDESSRAVHRCLALAREVGAARPVGRVSRQRIGELGFASGTFDVVVCSAVLHFAEDENDFDAMLEELWRVLAPRGLFFARLASTIGVEDLVEPLDGRRYRLPDGSVRFLVDRALLVDWVARLGGRLIEPVKTTVVEDQRAMTTWCLVKEG